jgi:hypothetical protein
MFIFVSIPNMQITDNNVKTLQMYVDHFVHKGPHITLFVFLSSVTCDLRETVGVKITSSTFKTKKHRGACGSYIQACTGVLPGIT